MTRDEAQKVATVLAALFPGRLPVETLKLWALDLMPFFLDDAIAGARRHARESTHPGLKGLLDAVRAERDDRLRREQHVDPVAALPANATPDEEQALRSEVWRKLAVDIALRRAPEIQSSDYEAEFQRRLTAARAAKRGEET